MPNIVTKYIKLGNARNFLDSLSSPDNSIYLMIGRPQPWRNEKTPQTPEDSFSENNKIWDESIALKRILPIDVRPVIPRINWIENTTYAEYNPDNINLWDTNFYVMNSKFDVYKCIDNNKESRSLIEPTGQSLNIFKTSDGYKWKFLYNIGISDQLRFLTRNWMPISNNTDTAEVAIDGGIENIKILNGGTAYSAQVKATIEGDGRNAEIIPRQRIGVINDFQIVNPGSGYRYATVIIEDSSGQYANAKAIVSPIKGHGGDLISELGGYRLMFNVKTQYNEGGGNIPPQIKFRRISIVKNPLTSSGELASALTYSTLKTLNVKDSTVPFVNGEYIEGVTSKATGFAVVSNIASGNGYVKFVQSSDSTNFKSFINGETLVGKLSSGSANIISNVSSEINHDSGSIIYTENRTAISRFPDQAENLHLVIEF